MNEELQRILMDPNISDEDKCKAIFKGEEFECIGCGEKIYWRGACDACIDKFERKGEPKNKREEVEAIGVMPSMSDASWGNWVDPKKLKTTTGPHTVAEINSRITRLRNWKGVPHLVVLSGPPGTGKTHMAIATLRRRIELKGYKGCMFLRGDRLVDALQNATDVVDRAWNVRLLVIDDFGPKLSAEFRRDMVASFICRRIDYGKPVLITTNLTGGDIEAIDERLASRMQEALVVLTQGLKDWRGTA
jgi:hypothetical protein